MQKYFYFYDLNEVLIDRYPAKIANYLSEKYQISKFIFIYSEKYHYAILQKIPNGSKAFYIPDLSLSKTKSLFQKYPPNSLTTIAQRIPDMLMLSIFNSEGIPTFLVQHGLWSDRLVRISLPMLLLSRFTKFTRYLSYTHRICRINKLPYFRLLLDLYRFLIKENIKCPESKYMNSDFMRAKTAFVFDNSWDDYYVNKYGYSSDSIVYMGNPDYMDLKRIKHLVKEDAVCYVCQTFVEDGRYSKRQYQSFLRVLNDFVASEKKLYMKLHPRSRRGLYASLESNDNIVFADEFPHCNYYIGHYSAMLAVARQCSENVLIWNLPDHHVPEYFYQFASIATDNPNKLRAFVNGEIEVPKDNGIHILSDDEIQELDSIRIIGDGIYKVCE